MGPIIIIDKSALQSLSFPELIEMHNFYTLNIAPILIVEILGDIKKESTYSQPHEKVTELAKKITPFSSIINGYYLDLLYSSLCGNIVHLERKPVLTHGQSVSNPEGEHGVLFKETPEEKALLRWRKGEFSDSEVLLGERWRESTRAIDLNNMKVALQSAFNWSGKIKSLDQLNAILSKMLMRNDIQSRLMVYLVEEFNLSMYGVKIFNRWDAKGRPLISYHAPYAYHCLRVNLFFKLALINDLIGTRPTNFIDLEYLYYTPFCMIFCSTDKFHRNVAPFFINKNQEFIDGNSFKSDLKKMVESKEKNGRVIVESQSLTDRMYKKFTTSKIARDNNIADKLSEEGNRKLAEYLRSKMDAINAASHNLDTQKVDFIFRETTIDWNDPCPCGGGKLFSQCHGPKCVEDRKKKENSQ